MLLHFSHSAFEKAFKPLTIKREISMFETPTFDSEDFTPDLPRDSRGRLFGDERLHVTFYTQAIENVERSKVEGRKIFEEHEFIRIAIPGDQYNQINTFATDAYKKRFPLDYKRFSEKTSATVVGTPIHHMPGISQAQAAEFNALHIRTVEDLAEMPDSTRVMGGQDLKRKAQAFLDLKREEAVATRAEETNALLKKQEMALAQRDAEVAALRAQVEALVAATDKKKKKAEE